MNSHEPCKKLNGKISNLFILNRACLNFLFDLSKKKTKLNIIQT
jgi:hypothetical protein